MNLAKLSTAKTFLLGPILDSAGVAKTDEVVASIKVTKNGTVGAVDAQDTLTHNHTGHYVFVSDGGDFDTLGEVEFTLDSGTNAMAPVKFQVLPATTYDAIVTNAAGAAGGMLLNGAANAGTTTLAALTITGAMTNGSTALGAVTASTIAASGAVTAASLTLSGVLQANSLVVSTTTALTGAVTLGAALTVTGTTTLAAITQTGAVSLGATTIASMAVTGALTVGGGITVTNSTPGGHALSLTGHVAAGNGLYVKGGATAGNGIYIEGSATGFGIVLDDMSVSGTVAFAGITASSLVLSGALQAATIVSTGTTTLNALTITNNAGVGGTLIVTGATTFTGAVTAANAANNIVGVDVKLVNTVNADTAIQTAANAALVANNLDHVALTATAIPAIPAGTYLDQMMDDGTATFDRTTDSLQAIRDTAPLGTAMRGTDNAALASTALSNLVWTDAKAGYLTGPAALEATLTAIKGAGWATETLAAIDVLVDDIKAKTDGLNFTGTDVKATLDSEEVTPTTASKTGYALTSGERNSVADALLDRTSGIETGVTPRQAWQRIGAVVAGECSGAGTGTEIFVGLDGSTERASVTVTSDGNRTAVEYDPA